MVSPMMTTATTSAIDVHAVANAIMGLLAVFAKLFAANQTDDNEHAHGDNSAGDDQPNPWVAGHKGLVGQSIAQCHSPVILRWTSGGVTSSFGGSVLLAVHIVGVVLLAAIVDTVTAQQTGTALDLTIGAIFDRHFLASIVKALFPPRLNVQCAIA